MARAKGIKEVAYVDIRQGGGLGRHAADCGLIYLLDRVRGLHVLERT